MRALLFPYRPSTALKGLLVKKTSQCSICVGKIRKIYEQQLRHVLAMCSLRCLPLVAYDSLRLAHSVEIVRFISAASYHDQQAVRNHDPSEIAILSLSCWSRPDRSALY